MLGNKGSMASTKDIKTFMIENKGKIRQKWGWRGNGMNDAGL